MGRVGGTVALAWQPGRATPRPDGIRPPAAGRTQAPVGDDMVANMKTTVDIADPVFQRAKKLAAERGTTLKVIVETALRQLLEKESKPRRRFKLRDASFKGRGMQPGIREGDWDTIRALTYEGRGG